MIDGRARRRVLVLGAGLVLAFGAGASAQSAAPGSELAGTDWLLGEITSGGTTTPIPSGTNARLLFSDDAAGGSTGCNRWVTDYQADGTSLTFGQIAMTQMACEDGLMALEQSYVAALATVASYAMTADTLTLKDPGGTTVLSYSVAPQQTVEGPWLVTGYNNGKGGIVTPTEEGVLTVSFGPEGTVEGHGGCNGFGGGYSVDGASIAIGPLMQTMMSCGEALDTQEQQYLVALQNATTWAIDSGVLELRDDSGAMQVEARSAIGH